MQGGAPEARLLGQVAWRTGDASLHETCDLELRLLPGAASSAALLSEMDVRLSCCRGPPLVLTVIALLSAWLIWICVSSIIAVMPPQRATLRRAVAQHWAACISTPHAIKDLTQ